MKAVIVVDVPDNICLDAYMGFLKIDKFYLDAEEISAADINAEPMSFKWLKLRPLPQKKGVDKSLEFGGYENIIQFALVRGFNACLDEIIGETE